MAPGAPRSPLAALFPGGKATAAKMFPWRRKVISALRFDFLMELGRGGDDADQHTGVRLWRPFHRNRARWVDSNWFQGLRDGFELE